MSDHDALRSLLADLKTATTLIKVRAAAAKASTLLDVAPVPTPVPTPTPTPVPTPTPTPQPTPVPAPVPVPTGAYRVQGADILKPDGTVLVPIGANLGTRSSFDWNGDPAKGLATWDGIADGHAADAKAWGWNVVRLNYVFTRNIGWSRMGSGLSVSQMVTEASATIAEYRQAGIAVMVACHYPGDDLASQDAVFTGLAFAFKADSGVWFNLNEHAWTDYGQWASDFYHLYGVIRGIGNNSIIVCDVMNGGNDAAWDGATKLVYDPTVGPALLQGKTNVVFGHHNYAGKGTAAYFDAVRAAGLAMLIGEFGFTTDGSSTAGDYTMNKAGAVQVFASAIPKKVGALVWHPSHGDNYSLKVNSKAFWDGGAGNGLSELGRSMWALTH